MVTWLGTYCKRSHYCPLQEASQHVTPVMFVVGDTGQTHIHGGGNQEELDGGAEKPRPLRLEPRLNVQLREEKKTKQ